SRFRSSIQKVRYPREGGVQDEDRFWIPAPDRSFRGQALRGKANLRLTRASRQPSPTHLPNILRALGCCAQRHTGACASRLEVALRCAHPSTQPEGDSCNVPRSLLQSRCLVHRLRRLPPTTSPAGPFDSLFHLRPAEAPTSSDAS